MATRPCLRWWLAVRLRRYESEPNPMAEPLMEMVCRWCRESGIDPRPRHPTSQLRLELSAAATSDSGSMVSPRFIRTLT